MLEKKRLVLLLLLLSFSAVQWVNTVGRNNVITFFFFSFSLFFASVNSLYRIILPFFSSHISLRSFSLFFCSWIQENISAPSVLFIVAFIVRIKTKQEFLVFKQNIRLLFTLSKYKLNRAS